MSRPAGLRHLAGLGLAAGLAAALYAWWPWPIALLRALLPGPYRDVLQPLIGDYAGLIGFLFAVLVLSLAHAAWTRLTRRGEGT